MGISVAVLFIIFGATVACKLKGTDKKIGLTLNQMSNKFVKDIAEVIKGEQKLRQMDQAFRILIIIEALSSVKRMFQVANDRDDNSSNFMQSHNDACRSIATSIDLLTTSM